MDDPAQAIGVLIVVMIVSAAIVWVLSKSEKW